MSASIMAYDPPASQPTSGNAPETFSREYVQELRRENEQWRHKARNSENDAIKARDAMELAKREQREAVAKTEMDAQAAIGAARGAAELRILHSELKVAALAAGMVHIDGLKLLDISDVTLDEAGELVVPENFFVDARKERPWLFGQNSTSSTSAAPRVESRRTKSVRDMDDKERRAFERQHGIYS